MSLTKTNNDTINVARCIQTGLSKLRRDDICTDFEVVIGDKCFRCHKVVLAAVSDYFQAMFSSGMEETVQNKAFIKDMLPEVFESTLDLIYDESGEEVRALYRKGVEEIEEYLRVAGMLQMSFLKEICLKYYKDKLQVQNCVEIWKIGRTLQIHELQTFSWIFMLSHFTCLSKVGLLPTLDFDDFKTLIGDENLLVQKEETVCDAILSWVNFDKAREDKIVSLLKCCSLSQIDMEYLVETLSFHPLCRKFEETLEIIKQAIKYKFHKDQHGNISLSLRSCTGMEQIPILLSGRTQKSQSALARLKAENACADIVGYSRRQGRWVRLQRPERGIGEEFAWCVFGTSFYITGGKPVETLTLRYAGDSNTWVEKAAMIVPLRKHTMTAHGDCLYIFGGCSLSDVNSQILTYNITENSWDIVGELIAPVHSASSARLDSKIYIVGGVLNNCTTDDAEVHVVDSVQVFYTKTKVCTLFCHMPNPCSFSRAVCDASSIFIVTGSGDVVVIKEDRTEAEIVAQIPDFNRTNFGSVLHKKLLSVYGGVSQENNPKLCESVFTIDISTGSVSAAKPLPAPLEVHGSLQLVVSSKNYTME